MKQTHIEEVVPVPHVSSPKLRGPFQKFVDWRQCAAVMQKEAVTVIPICRKRRLKWVATLPLRDINTESWSSGMGIGRRDNNPTLWRRPRPKLGCGAKARRSGMGNVVVT
jgi:hypothetical protein